MSESQGANDAKELYSEIVVENLSERSKGFAQGSKSQGPEGQSPEVRVVQRGWRSRVSYL